MTASPPSIFISYRRDDTAFVATALCEKLVAQFGSDRVFMDVDTIPAGRNFRHHVQSAVARCNVVLALVGDRWLEARDDQGERRLDLESDWVRIEIESALACDVIVIPILVSPATMPKARDLPQSLRELTYRQAVVIRPGRDFARDVELLGHEIERTLAHTEKVPTDAVSSRSDVAPRAAAQQTEGTRSEPLPIDPESPAINTIIGDLPAGTYRFQASVRRGLTAFTGRQHELAQLDGAAALALFEKGQIAAVIGEPGVGKSRLLHELKARLADRFSVAEAFCDLRNSNALRPVSTWVTTVLGTHSTEADDVSAAVLHLDSRLAETVPFLQLVLGSQRRDDSPVNFMEGAVRRQRIFEALKRILAQSSQQRALCLLLDDAQWADIETLQFVQSLGTLVLDAKIFLVISARPEFRPPWLADVCSLQIRLDPLRPAEAKQLISTLAGPQPTSFQSLLMDRTGGNPFFIEEVVRSLLDEGWLVRGPSLTLRPSIRHITIPSSVHELLASRINALDASAKEFLQVASVLGQRFSVTLAEGVSEMSSSSLNAVIETLQGKGFLVEQLDEGGRACRFRHALMQETAYQSLSATRRKDLHARCAKSIESMYRSSLEPHFADLGRHCREASQPVRAIYFFERAAQAASARAAEAEEVELLRSALAMIEGITHKTDAIHATELRILARLLGPTIILCGGTAPETKEIAQRAYALCDHVDDRRLTFEVVRNYWNLYTIAGDWPAAKRLGEELLARARASGDDAELLEAHRALSENLLWRGHFAEVIDNAKRAIALYDPAAHQHHALLYGEDPGIAARGFAAAALSLIGCDIQAEALVRESLALSPALQHPVAHAMALVFAMVSYHIRNVPERALAMGATLEQICEERGIASWGAWGRVLHSWALASVNVDRSACDALSETVRAIESSGVCVALVLMLTAEADALLRTGRFHDVGHVLTKARAASAKYGESWLDSEVTRLDGEAQLALGDASASAKFEEAADIAHRIGARLLELRAVLAFSRLDRGIDSRARLKQCLEVLPEPGDSSDVRAAQAFLAS